MKFSWRPPPLLRGLGWRERRGLDKLARSGLKIEDPQTADTVRAWIEYLSAFYRGSVGKILYLVGPFFVVPPFTIGFVVRWMQGNVWHAGWDAALLALYAFSWGFHWRQQRDRQRTAFANGWMDQGD